MTGVVDDCSPDEELLVEVEVEDEDELVVEDEVVVEVLAVAVLELPGMV